MNTPKSNVPAVIKALVQPRETLPNDIEEALLGNSIDELGLSPQEVNISQVQYLQVVKIFEALSRAVEQGRKDEFRAAISYMLQNFSDGLVGILTRAGQWHKEVAREARNNGFFRGLGKRARHHKQEALHLGQVIEYIETSRGKLETALSKDFELEPDLANIMRIQPILEYIHKRALKLGDLVLELTTNAEKDTILSGKDFAQLKRECAELNGSLQAYSFERSGYAGSELEKILAWDPIGVQNQLHRFMSQPPIARTSEVALFIDIAAEVKVHVHNILSGLFQLAARKKQEKMGKFLSEK